MWLDGADVVDEDSPTATLTPSSLAPATTPALADATPREPAEARAAEPLDVELAALSRRTRRPRRTAALVAGVAALATVGTVVALTVPRRTVIVSGAVPARAAPAATPAAPALERAGAPAMSAVAVAVAEAPRPEPTAAASAAPGADLSAAVKAAVSGGAIDDLNTTPVVVRSSPPGAMLFRDAKQIGRDTTEVRLRHGERAIVLALLDQHEPTRVTLDGSRPEVVIVLPRLTRTRASAPAAAPKPRTVATSPAPPAATPRAPTATAPTSRAETPGVGSATPAPVAPEPPTATLPDIDTTDLPPYPDPFTEPL